MQSVYSAAQADWDRKSFNYVQIKLLVLDSTTWNHLTVCKQMSSDSFKNCYLHTIRLQTPHT